jgi:adenylate cyclase
MAVMELERFQSALDLYRARQWKEAKKAFTELLIEVPNDTPCKIYIERCDFFVEKPPSDEWDGVFNRTEK